MRLVASKYSLPVSDNVVMSICCNVAAVVRPQVFLRVAVGRRRNVALRLIPPPLSSLYVLVVTPPARKCT